MPNGTENFDEIAAAVMDLILIPDRQTVQVEYDAWVAALENKVAELSPWID